MPLLISGVRWLLLASLQVSPRASAWTPTLWSSWFLGKRYGLDAYFFFRARSAGVTACPENVRLTLVKVDSLTVTLDVLDEAAKPAKTRVRCTIWYADLEDAPRTARMRDGRTMWTLRGRPTHANDPPPTVRDDGA